MQRARSVLTSKTKRKLKIWVHRAVTDDNIWLYKNTAVYMYKMRIQPSRENIEEQYRAITTTIEVQKKSVNDLTFIYAKAHAS